MLIVSILLFVLGLDRYKKSSCNNDVIIVKD